MSRESVVRPDFDLLERMIAKAAILRNLSVNDLVERRSGARDSFDVDDAAKTRHRGEAPLLCEMPVGEDPAVRSRDALVASIDEAAINRLRDLHIEACKGRLGDSTPAGAVFRCWRRLRAAAETGLFMHDYYAYQARVTGTPCAIFMHYLDEVPEVAAQPNPLFNAHYYLTANRTTRTPLHPFLEYALYRRKRGATTHWSFSDTSYAQRAGVEVKDAMWHCLTNYHAYARTEASSELVKAYASCDARAIESFIFDPDCYGRLYEDMASATIEERATHYLRHGAGEGRFGCIGEHLHGMGLSNHFTPVDFDAAEYGELNPDLAAQNTSEIFLLEHFLTSGLREGRHYTRKAFNVPRPTAQPLVGAPDRSDDLPVGIFVHMFYPDMWPTIRDYLRNMRQVKYRLLVNLVTSSFDAQVFAEIRREFPDAQILISPNEGRDIGGLFRLFAEADFNQLSAVAICHSKKSPHLAEGLGQTWMRDLMDAYAATPESFADNLLALKRDPQAGIIASAKWRRIGVGEANDAHYKLISSLLPSLKGQNPEYPSGTMFLAKPEIVAGVFSALEHLDFENGDGLDLKLHIDGQIAHAVERAFGHMARSLNLDILWR